MVENKYFHLWNAKKTPLSAKADNEVHEEEKVLYFAVVGIYLEC